MYFRRTCFPQELDDSCAGRTAYDRVVDHNHTLSLDGGGNRIQLNSHFILTGLLTGCDKGSADILILDEADAVRNSGSLRISYCGGVFICITITHSAVFFPF